MTTVKINLENGDYFITRINCTAEEACNYYRIGSYINVGADAENQRISTTGKRKPSIPLISL